MDEVMPMLVPSDLCLCQVLYLVSVYKCKIYSLQCEFKSSGCCDDEDTRQRYLSRFGYLDVNTNTRYIHKNWWRTQTLFYGSGGCVFWCCFDILPPPPVYGKYDNLSSALNVVTDLLQFSKRKIDVVSWQNCHVCHVTGPQRTLILSLITAPFMMFRWSSPRKLCHLL